MKRAPGFGVIGFVVVLSAVVHDYARVTSITTGSPLWRCECREPPKVLRE